MYAPNLTQVLVTGALEPGPFADRELEVLADDFGEFPASARAVAIAAENLFDDRNRQALVSWARKRARPALDRGIGVVVAAAPDQVNLASQSLSQVFRSKRANLEYVERDRAAQACLRLQPGPPPRWDLTIECDHPIDEETAILLRRAFAEFDRIVLAPLAGGRSAITGIWRIDAQSRDKDLHSPFVAKCGPRPSITEQVDTYRDVVADRVPYRGCAPLCIERSVAGSTKRLLVSRFVERAKRLDEVLLDPACPDVPALIERIYFGPLHRWRADVEHLETELLPPFLPEKMIEKYRAGLQRTRKRLARAGYTVSTPRALIAALAALPRIRAPFCRAHDDLNFRNVFVGEDAREIILIDFTRAIKQPLSKDVARLDVGLAFDDELNAMQPIPDAVLLDFFAGDLFAISLRHAVDAANAGARLAAIEALRRHILAEADRHGYDPRREYRVAIIAGLLYEAKRRTKWSDIAYRCADALAKSHETAS